MPKLTIFISFLYVSNSLMVAELGVYGAPFNQRDIVVTSTLQELNTGRLQRRGSYQALIARSPQQKETQEKKDSITQGGNDTVKTIQKAASELFKATKNVDNAVLIIQNPNSTAAEVKKAAEEALKNEDNEDFPRQALASAARDPQAAQGSLAVIRDKGPEVVGALKAIAANPEDKQKVKEELAKVTLHRLQIVPANFALMGGVEGGNRKLISTVPIGPSQKAIGTKITDPTQKKVIEEQQKALTNQTKIVDEQVAIIRNEGAKPEEIEEAAKKALVQEAAEEFAREVLASAASDAKAAMAALAEVRDNGPSKVVHGLKQIEKKAKDTAAVKKNIELVIEGRKHVVPANLKLIELSGGSAVAGAATTTAAATTGTGTGATGSTGTGTTAKVT